MAFRKRHQLGIARKLVGSKSLFCFIYHFDGFVFHLFGNFN